MSKSFKTVSVFLAACLLGVTVLASYARADTQRYLGAPDYLGAGNLPWDLDLSNTCWDFLTHSWVDGNDAFFDTNIFGAGSSKTVPVDHVTASSITFWDYYVLTGGTIALAGTARIAPFTYNCQIDSQLAGTHGLEKSGDATLTLTGENTYSGATTITVGNLSVSRDANLGNSSGIVFAGGTLQITGDNFISSKNIAANSTANIEQDSATSATLAGVISGAGGLNKTGSGVLILSHTNSYTGDTVVSAGTLALNNSAALAGSTLNWSKTYGGSIAFGSLTTATFGGLTGDRDFALTNSYSQPVALSVGTATDMAFSGELRGNGSLTKNGTGLLSLSGSNTYSGGTTVNRGTLQLGNAAALGSGGVTVGGPLGQYCVLDLNGFSPNPLPSLNGSDKGVVTDNRVPTSPYVDTMLTVNTASGDSTYNGQITRGAHNQDIALVKTGLGRLTLTGASNYGGGTWINQGVLSLTGSLTGGGPILIAGGATLAASGTQTGSVSGQAGSTITASGNLVLGNDKDYSGFVTYGSLANNGHAVTLNSAGPAILGGETYFAGGALSAPNGVSLGVGSTLWGYGTVNAKVAGGIGSTIAPTGSLVMGNSTAYDGFATAGNLNVGSYAVTLNSAGFALLGGQTSLNGGTLTAVNGTSLGNGSSLRGYGTVVGKIAGGIGSTIAPTGNLTLGDNAAYDGFATDGNLNVGSYNVTLNSAGFAALGGYTSLDGGTLTASHGISLGNGSTLTGYGSIAGKIAGGIGSTIMPTGNITLGSAAYYDGFATAGNLNVGGYTVTLSSRALANLGGVTTIDGGTLAAPNGISLGNGSSLAGLGAVNAKIAAGTGSTIAAYGDLTLGNLTAYDGFISDGQLYTNGYTVTLLSGHAADNRNAVVLGSYTEIYGTLAAPTGFLLQSGRNLVSYSGGNVSRSTGPITSQFLNRGNVQGPDASSTNWLYFDLPFKGSTGVTAGNIGFLGGYSPGDSPGINAHSGNAQLGGISEFDIGGTTAGSGDGHYSQLDVLGNLNLVSGATLSLEPWNGFLPSFGDHFTLLIWTGSRTGSLSIAPDPWYDSHGVHFVSQWLANSLVLTPAIDGDASLDGVVNENDLSVILTNFNKSGMTWSQGDFTGNGVVNEDDLSKVLTNFNKSVGASAAAIKAVPEPAGLVLLGIGIVSLSCYGWRQRLVGQVANLP